MHGVNGNELPRADSMRVLNRLLVAFQYSLARYLGYAQPWTHPGNARLLEAIRQITADHKAHTQVISELILERRSYVKHGRFPTGFTAYNDLALDYLARRLVEHERELIDEVARSIDWLGGDPEARKLVATILAVEKQHLRTLSTLVLGRTETRGSHDDEVWKSTSPANIRSDIVPLISGSDVARVQRH